MTLFLSTSTHRIDRKGRVSVPAAFRAALEGETFRGVALSEPLSGAPCVEGSGIGRVAKMAEALSAMNPLTEEREALSMALLAGVTQAPFDGEGRIVLSEDLIAHAGLSGAALFAGLGDKFQIWEPEAFKARRAEALKLARERAASLPWNGGGGTS